MLLAWMLLALQKSLGNKLGNMLGNMLTSKLVGVGTDCCNGPGLPLPHCD